jgi:HEAT repeat protein
LPTSYWQYAVRRSALTKPPPNDWIGRVGRFLSEGLGQPGPDVYARDLAAVPVLLDLLNENDPRIRRNVIFTLGQIGPAAREAIPDLIRLLQSDSDPHVRGEAAYALSIFGPEAAPILLLALRDADGSLPKYIIHALGLTGGNGPAVVRKLVELLRDDRYEIRSAADYALSEVGQDAQESVPVLLQILYEKQNPPFRYAIVRALMYIEGWTNPKLATDLLTFLLTLLRDRDGNVRRDAIKALSEMREAFAYASRVYGMSTAERVTWNALNWVIRGIDPNDEVRERPINLPLN